MYFDSPANDKKVRRSSSVTIQAQRVQPNITILHLYDINGDSPASLSLTDKEMTQVEALIKAAKNNKELGEITLVPSNKIGETA